MKKDISYQKELIGDGNEMYLYPGQRLPYLKMAFRFKILRTSRLSGELILF